MAANRETSSSTGIVFAKAKSEWVIPQRAKPGRKSSKANLETQSVSLYNRVQCLDLVADSSTCAYWTIQKSVQVTTTTTTTASGSRDAQRAFRERKTEYVSSLESRIEAFEKGEIQRNVALQSTARAMKEENIKIKTELVTVKRDLVMRETDGKLKSDKIGALESALVEMREKLTRMERRVRETERRAFEQLQHHRSIVNSRCGSCGHRPRSESGASSPASSLHMEDRYDGSPLANERFESNAMDFDTLPKTVSPLSDNEQRPRLPTRSRSGTQNPPSSSHNFQPLQSDDEVDSISRQVAMDMACGFCEGIESVCVCRIVRENERKGVQGDSIRPISPQGSIMGILYPVTKQLTPTYHAEITAAVRSTSILDNLPPVEAAVPLRRRQRTGDVFGIKKVPIFAVSPAIVQGGQSPLYIPPAECSGDPRNCPACKDDEFGESSSILSF
jgi:hypothetical protein